MKTLLLLAISLFFFQCNVVETKPEKTDSSTAVVAAAVARAGGNGPEIKAFLAGYSGEQRRSAEFLITYMPTVDLAALSAAQLRENFDLAWRGRTELPWAKEIPLALFVHYVLPHRVTQEPYLPWRAALYGELKDYLAGCTDLVDAALAVNRWCGKRIKFRQTEFRDQNALVTLRAGYGRCEELAILCICALRAAGIPARGCSTPWWAVNDNNHAWVEVWAGGSWHYIGGCEPGKALDRTWFRKPAQRAGFVVSTVYGIPKEYNTGDRVYRHLQDSALVNSTAVYARTGTLAVSVVDTKGKAVPDCAFALAVFNYGGLRALTKRTTDAKGRGKVALGMGEYFLSAGRKGARAFAVVKMVPGQELPLTLVLKPGAVPPESFWLRYPTPAEATRAFAAGPGGGGKQKATFTPKLTPPPTPDYFNPKKDRALKKMLASFPRRKELHGFLEKARGNWRELARAIKEIGKQRLGLSLEFLSRLTNLDRLELPAEVMVDHVLGAAPFKGVGLPKKVYTNYLLKPGVHLEHLGAWRRILAGRLAKLAAQKPAATAELVQGWVEKNLQSNSRGRLGPLMNPLQVYTSRRATGAEKVIFTVAALRSLGVPARKAAHRDLTEYYAGDKWLTLKLGSPAKGNSLTGEKERGPATLRLGCTRNDKPLPAPRGFALSRFQGGMWSPLRGLRPRRDQADFLVDLPAGEYLFSAGVRNPNGDAWVQTRLFSVAPKASHSLALMLDLPADAGIFKFPIVRPLPKVLAKGSVGTLVAGLVKGGPVLLFFFAPDHEPSLRGAGLVKEAFAGLRQKGVQGLGVCLGKKDKSIKMPFPVIKSTTNAVALFGITGASEALPSVLLLQKGGKPLLWVEGYEMKLGVLLNQAARQIR